MTDHLTDEQLREWRDNWVRANWGHPIAVEVFDELLALRARVAQLEAALRNVRKYAEDHDDEFVPFVVDAALAQPAESGAGEAGG